MSKVVSFIRGFGIWFKVLISELAHNIISVILVALLYFLLWHFPQTLDLLLVLNQNDAASFWQIFTVEVPLYFSLLLIISFFVWNAPKYYFKTNYSLVKFKNVIGFVPTKHYDTIVESTRYAYNCKHHVRKVLPRVLGCLVLFMSAFAILNAMDNFGIDSGIEKLLNPFNTFLVIGLFLVLLLEYHTYCFINKLVRKVPKMNYIIAILVVLLFILILGLGATNTQAEEDLSLLFISNLALALIFFMVSFNTRNLLNDKYKPLFYGGIIVAGLLVLLVYIIFNCNPELSRSLNPLSVLLICLIALYTISFLFVFGGKKLRFPLFTFMILIGFFLGEFNANSASFDHYSLDKKVQTTHKRVAMKQYVHDWITNRKDKIMQAENGSYPVLFVSSEGGGSRAGLWAFLIHSYLSEQSDNAYYEDYLFSMSGASGGGVGNGMFFATAQQAIELNTKLKYTSDEKFKYKASELYAENYLSTSIVGLLGRDLFKNILGLFSFDNRGELLQNEWQAAHKAVFKLNENHLEKEVLSFYSKSNVSGFVPPLLLMNSSHAQTGKYSVVSPVDFSKVDAFSGYYDFMKQLKIVKGEKRSIKLSEAMRMNAAFPYLTPAGEVKGMGLFGDAGYYDNIGGTVTTSLMSVFKEVLTSTPEFNAIKDKVALKSVLIFSDLDKKGNLNDQSAPISQLGAPLKTLMNVRSGHTNEQIAKLNQVPLALQRTYIIPSTKTSTVVQEKLRSLKNTQTESISPILPLGRYLSGTAIQAIEKCLELDNVKRELDKLLIYNRISDKTIDNEHVN